MLFDTANRYSNDVDLESLKKEALEGVEFLVEEAKVKRIFWFSTDNWEVELELREHTNVVMNYCIPDQNTTAI